MNRSRIVAAGTSVGALVAITAGVAAANPAPTSNTGIGTAHRVVSRATPLPTQVPAPTDPSFGSDDQGSSDWQPLPPDTSASGPAPGTDPNQAPAFDPNGGANLGGSDTRSGGS